MKKRALISVYNKDGIDGLAAFLDGSGWEILSTGGTAGMLRKKNIPVTDISAVTGFPECLDGRVKTLHPAIHAGLLARRSEKSHMETLDKLALAPIDLVCVNLYPFFEKSGEGLSLDETIEFIDIGGPAMLRSAAKNFRDVIVLTDPSDYGETVAALESGAVPDALRKRLAARVFTLTSAYDAAVARYLMDGAGDGVNTGDADTFPSFWPLSLKKIQNLRYGENGHQKAALYFNTAGGGALPAMEQLHGKELSYNNIRDLDLAWKAVTAFGLSAAGAAPLGDGDLERLGMSGGAETSGAAACCAVKHNTPCGIALDGSLAGAFEKTRACDPVSIFGGIVAANVPVDALTAEKLAEIFLEIVAAPDFAPDALEILKKKKNLRIMKASFPPGERRECIAVDGGMLVQETDRKLLEKWEVVTKTSPAAEDIADLVFGLRAVAFVKSNAIMVVRDRASTGIAGGQVNRIWSAEQALARSAGISGAPSRVLASDAFFPFPDVVEAAAAAGIRAIIQPGGSVNDSLSIEACDRHGIAMVFTGTRHFRH
ncbi:MAG: bifunctional phosphoribosylaminoimidazolecarboxamide formyltransferase/IMP cyclohydrolase [Treponema sp.]|jgi:phosphoribosylaminoimidazolecarboxamide formyltransferase/IMP cyclohydrolase|nr:bifunctional phosphoribosylaminoimidazolecarboxamide formyltransferase/IMP cyclohydrolase [Treponema sp.]